ncbi:dolichyl-phosphate-mannose--protein mannosyltransferase [Microbacterium oleivorans]|uniref:dolichyl-phosphate-mannose--protein mannosyltransferase n=1 Tax=Microbacterium oleivorans TaxID=273677 RepID=UPI00203C5432|nr:phospholipid carrier-dependent glycosyltransferase [Microbacterium oleivorans]MCM3696121.1 phospholipid carrier-dependent glycosyltransferase [Microbacterium oleivorans]
MSSTAEPLLPAVPARQPLSARLDTARRRLAVDAVLGRRLAWIAPLAITLLAGILRFWNLGHPHAIVFDETYYVKDAWSQWNLGYASTWPEDADGRFTDGETDIYTDAPSFVVHPPLGKLLIGAGMALFGPTSSFGWRVAVALAGTLAVLVLYLIAWQLTRSVLFSSVAAGLMAIDGLAIVMSRVAILDVLLTFFVLLSVWFFLIDRRRHLDRLAEAMLRRDAAGRAAWWGPVLWGRPWLVAAGIAGGAACGVKWSGAWVLAALGLYTVVSDALARRRLGIHFWPADAVRQGVASFVLLVPVAVLVYIAAWTTWLTTDGGYERHSVDADPARGFWSWVPLPLQNLWHYHQTIYTATAEITSSHPYASPAWQWPLLLRPTSMYANSTADGVGGCASARGCIEILYSMPNPLLWWLGVLAVLWLAVYGVRTRDWRAAVVLAGVAATYVPWLFYPSRTIFQFYTVLILPFLILALTFALRAIAGSRHADPHRRAAGRRTVLVILGVILAVSAFWYPLWSAIRVPWEFYWLHNWLTGWV